MKRVLLGAAVAAIAMVCVAGTASADALDDIKKSGKIRIAVDLGVPPYGMTDEKMQPTGSDIETAKQHLDRAKEESVLDCRASRSSQR